LPGEADGRHTINAIPAAMRSSHAITPANPHMNEHNKPRVTDNEGQRPLDYRSDRLLFWEA
jgi:hypothetical protein